MSEVAEVAQSPKEQYLQANSARLEAEYADNAANVDPVEETDTDDGTPEDSMESEVDADGALATTEDDEFESDTDSTPDDDETEGGGYEQRFKDTQAALTEKSQEFSDLKTEYSDRVGALTQAEFDVNDKFGEAEQVATFWSNIAQQDLMQLQQVNVQQLNQQQYAQWQQQVGMATQKANQLNQALANTQQQTKKIKDEQMQRQVAVSRAELDRSIDNFGEVYGDIGKYAIESGVDPKVWQDITDPGLVKILHKAMVASNQPDAIETVTTKTKAKKQQTRNLRDRDEHGRYKANDKAFKTARNPAERRNAYLQREQARYAREYGR